jgi:hypothetical protein
MLSGICQAAFYGMKLELFPVRESSQHALQEKA